MALLPVMLALLGLRAPQAYLNPSTHPSTRHAALAMKISDDGAMVEILGEAREAEEVAADEAADNLGKAARAAIGDARVHAEAAVAELRAEVEAAGDAHAVSKALAGKGSVTVEAELVTELRKPPGTIAIIAAGAKATTISMGGFDLDDPVYLSAEFREGGATALLVDLRPGEILRENALRDTAAEQQTALGEFPGPLPIIARGDFIDEMQLAQVASDGATAVLLSLQLNGEEQTGALMAAATELGLESIVRVGTEEEVQAAVRLGAEAVCIGDAGLRLANEMRGLLPSSVVSVCDVLLDEKEAVRNVWRVRDTGFDAVILSGPLMHTVVRERAPPSAVIKAMRSKGSAQFGLGMKLGRYEGAKETLGEIVM